MKAIVSQLVVSLGVAERVYGFEHRDLHWGNILIYNTPASVRMLCRPNIVLARRLRFT